MLRILIYLTSTINFPLYLQRPSSSSSWI